MVRKYWKEENGVHTLYYMPFYDEIKLAEIELDGDECDLSDLLEYQPDEEKEK